MAYCVGKENYRASVDTEWYGYKNKAITEDTRCAYCYEKLKELGLANDMYHLADHSSRIDCDSVKDMSFSAMTFMGFNFQVVTPDGNAAFLLHTPKAGARSSGVYVVEMPEIADYCIRITQPDKFSNSDVYYTINIKVGNKDVIINNNDTLYYRGTTNVNGFETGKKASFKFVADKPNLSTSSTSNDPISNIITINIKTYKRIPKVVRQVNNWWRNTERSGLKFGVDNQMRGRSFSEYDERGTVLNSMSEEKITRVAGAATPKVFGGKTEVGDRHVANVNYDTTSDRFELISGFVATIQLIHVERPDFKEARRKRINEQIQALQEKQQKMLEEQQKLLLPIEPVQPTVEPVFQPTLVVEPVQPVVEPVPEPIAPTDPNDFELL